jgi:hypothetical protein
MPRDPAMIAAFEALWAEAARSGGDWIDYRLDTPKWQFLCHLADSDDVVLHGSGDPDIKLFEPRQPNDSTVFGNQKAVYAASDGLWPMYFAILDRQRYPMFLINSSMRLLDARGGRGDPFYFFSISDHALKQRPFRQGTIYILPRRSFMQQPRETHQGQSIEMAQWASLEAVQPLAKLAIGPEDFPLLDQLRGHDDAATMARIKADPDGFPWVRDDQPKR